MKILIIAFMLCQLSANEMRMLMTDLSTESQIETNGLMFQKDVYFKDLIIIRLGDEKVSIKELDFFRLINEVEELEELQNNTPAKE